ncbi:hypothetical protein [Hyphomicrobium sp. CS1BSMeth3]|nr:hypothetical protein [Hyphomicrobium sp. CS1BSMeth3]
MARGRRCFRRGWIVVGLGCGASGAFAYALLDALGKACFVLA